MEETVQYRSPSLYAAIRLARLVQKVRHRLKARVLCRRERNAHLVCEAVSDDLIRTQPHSRTVKTYTPNMGQNVNFTGLLQDLDEQVSKPGLPTSVVAAQDDLFLKHVAANFNTKSIRDASHILDVSTLLVERIQYARATTLWSAPEYKSIDRDQCEKYLANLEHLLLCFQQAALEALLRHSLDKLEQDFQHWRRYLNQQSKVSGDYFSEWVGGRPPLNSTMPWNIKPSLVVLWGVCWMFYAHNDNSVSPDGPASRSGSNSGFVRQTSWPQGYGMQNQSPSNPQSSAGASQPHLGSGNVGLGLHVTESPVTHSMYQVDSAAVGPFTQQTPQQAIPSQYTGQSGVPTLHQPKPSNTYIRTANITPSTASDASFPASSPAWNQEQGSTQAYSIGHNVWQPGATGNISTPTPVFHYQQGAVSQYDPTSTVTTTAQPFPRGIYGAAQYTNPYNYTSSMMPSHGQTAYPPSPHSEASGRENSIMPLGVTEPLLESPRRPDEDDLSAGSREPPRNAYNQIYCDHHECAQKPPTFGRKCEWSKHMDKHTRPYVCRQPGCEKIRGFTYSGGLLRHEREVHRKYGGPKAPRFCPHKDCKRSTGQGFSRKENLHEHLRRVHRGVGIAEDDNVATSITTQPTTTNAVVTATVAQPVTTPVLPTPSAPTYTPKIGSVAGSGGMTKTYEAESSNSGSMRKRKRPTADAHEGESGATETEAFLREENKRLKNELAEQQRKLHDLEAFLMNMDQGHLGQIMRPQA